LRGEAEREFVSLLLSSTHNPNSVFHFFPFGAAPRGRFCPDPTPGGLPGLYCLFNDNELVGDFFGDGDLDFVLIVAGFARQHVCFTCRPRHAAQSSELEVMPLEKGEGEGREA